MNGWMNDWSDRKREEDRQRQGKRKTEADRNEGPVREKKTTT